VSDSSNPALYRKMSEPFQSREAAEAALGAFYEELRALREKHRVRDVSATWSFSYLLPDGVESESVGRCHIGDQMREVQMASWALGEAEASFVSEVARLRRAAGRRK
jgi:hypothetical protein